MATLSKVPINLSGFLGGPGVNTFYVNGEVSGAGILPFKTFYATMAGQFPDEVRFDFPTSGVTVDSVTGLLNGGWAADAQTSVQGSNTGAYASGVGGVVRWVTGTVFNGRLLRGRSFLVPFGGNQFENNGLMTLATQAFVLEAANDLIADLAASLVVWHRPVAEANGSAIPALGAYVPRTPAILRSRRD